MYTTEPAPFGRKGTILLDENGVELMCFTEGDHQERAEAHAELLNREEANAEWAGVEDEE